MELLHIPFRLTVCQSIALASMCSITTKWSCTLKQLNQWLPLALLALNTVLGVLLNGKIHHFTQQVNKQSALERTFFVHISLNVNVEGFKQYLFKMYEHFVGK